jgi:AcrR family transcriptional regulator
VIVDVDQQAYRTSTREKIPVVALKLFAERGYEATSMREIAEQLGMTKAALYYHFDSKEDIVRALLSDLLVQVDQLVAWARTQEPGQGLRLEVLARWSEIMHAHGLAMFRFVVTNGNVFQAARDDRPGTGITDQVRELIELLTPDDASVEDHLRIRLALMSVNMAGIAGADLDADEAEVLSAARKIATELLPAER